MDQRIVFLVLPSTAVLVLLLVHSWQALPRRRAILFWISVAVYGLLRGIGVRRIAEEGLEGALPYVVHDPLLRLWGVPAQEIVGWAIVAYLAWWLGTRLAPTDEGGKPRLFPQLLWSALFLAAISWAVEAAATAAGWWHWTVPAGSDLLLDVPWIGLLDWAFVALDFLLPFLVLTSPALGGRPLRYLTLAAFPLHFLAHLEVDPVLGPIPGLHLAHWGLAGVLIWLALRSRVAERAFTAPAHALWTVPGIALGLVVADLALVDLVLARNPRLLLTLVPALVIATLAWRRSWGLAAGGAALASSPWLPPTLLGAAPAAAEILIPRRRAGRAAAAAVMVAVGAGAWALHDHLAGRQAALLAGIDRAIAARDSGELGEARRVLRGMIDRHPGEHAPRLLLAEIDYRTGRLEAAASHYRQALRIKPDIADAHRHLAVIALRQDRPERSAELAARGLQVLPGDPELLYLRARAEGRPVTVLGEDLDSWGAGAHRALVGLAFEVGDAEGARQLVERALDRWPDERWFHSAATRLALARGDRIGALAALDAWRQRFPDDPEARHLEQRLRTGQR